jgi:iron complex transport system substrate-binding protein
MPISRRTLLAGASAALLAPRGARAATMTDDAGRSVAIPDKVHHVFPAGMPAAILLYTLAPERLMGWPGANPAEACAYLSAETCSKPELGHLTSRNHRVDLGSVTARKPDFILDVGATDGRFATLADAVQKQTGIPYVLLDGRVLSLSTTYEKLGHLIGRDAEGADFADYCNQTLAVVTNSIAFVTADKRPKVYYARGPNGLTTGLGGASQMESIELLARNAGGGIQGGLADVTVEQVRQWEPDVIVATDADFAARVGDDPSWAAVKAVRERRVYRIPRLPFGWLDAPASANRLLGLWWLGKLLYPNHFKQDLREITRDFYAKFYHVTPSAQQIERLLAGTG